MISLRTYFSLDFSEQIRFVSKSNLIDQEYESLVMMDFESGSCFISYYIPAKDIQLQFLITLLSASVHEKFKFNPTGECLLPTSKKLIGVTEVGFDPKLIIRHKCIGETNWMDITSLILTKHIYLYIENELSKSSLDELYKFASEKGLILHYRSKEYLDIKNKAKSTHAFISHDWNDKYKIAQPLADDLISLGCKVWYDNYTLMGGNHINDTIEEGIANSLKCILIISPSFLTNIGGAKFEFEKILKREKKEKNSLIIPIWYDVTFEMVNEYSEMLATILGYRLSKNFVFDDLKDIGWRIANLLDNSISYPNFIHKTD